MKNIAGFLVIAILLNTACKNNNDQKPYFDIVGMDTTINPADNFSCMLMADGLKTPKYPTTRAGGELLYALRRKSK